jgi:DnaJ-class molecular chaperone
MHHRELSRHLIDNNIIERSFFNMYLYEYKELLEGEQICLKCDGYGNMTCTETIPISLIPCNVCKGEGKLNWAQYVFCNWNKT